jgi:hypothetical protein
LYSLPLLEPQNLYKEEISLLRVGGSSRQNRDRDDRPVTSFVFLVLLLHLSVIFSLFFSYPPPHSLHFSFRSLVSALIMLFLLRLFYLFIFLSLSSTVLFIFSSSLFFSFNCLFFIFFVLCLILFHPLRLSLSLSLYSSSFFNLLSQSMYNLLHF